MSIVHSEPSSASSASISLCADLWRDRFGRFAGRVVVLCAVLLSGTTTAYCQYELERDPINYEATPAQDPVARIQEELANGKLKFEYTPKHGYLESILKQLDIPVSSQVLVFSKTSMQIMKISPRTPRAIYFNDDSYVAWVPNGDYVEVMSTDPHQGQMFYTLNQTDLAPAELSRDTQRCVSCHVSSRTENVPGVLARSVFPNRGGRPDFSAGTFNTDQRSPFEERWGGWYVTGTHGEMRHMGNAMLRTALKSEKLDLESGANLTDLSDRFPVADYLSPHSDLVALLVLNHQAQMHNLLTVANYECRLATHMDSVMNRALDRPSDYQSESTQRRIASVGDKLLHYLLFCDEFPLTASVAGTSAFAKEFVARGPRDKAGRSLRDFDLKTRLFKYPCSYLIYSPSFQQLPKPVKDYVVTRLHDVLTSKDQDEAFHHLTTSDRESILKILQQTLPDLWPGSVKISQAP